MRFYWLLVGTLAVWRVTHLVVLEDGPWRMLARLRRAGGRLSGELLDCFYCTSLWIAAPAAWLTGEDWRERALLWLALSGGAILLERATLGTAEVPRAAYHEDKDDDDGVLRK